jgi:hypothetical protein
MVSGLQERGDDVGIHREMAPADLFQYGFDPVREIGNRLQADHPRGSLEAMSRPKCLVQVRTVPLAALQFHQALFQADQELTRLFEEHLAEPVV